MKTYLYLALFLLTILGVSCSKERGCKDEQSINYNPDAELPDNSCRYPTIQIAVDLRWGNVPFENNRIYNLAGYNTAIKNFECLLSEFELIDFATSKTIQLLPKYHYLAAANTDFGFGEIELRQAQQLQFKVGLSANQNHVQSSILDSDTLLYWNATDGHVFLRLTGKVDRNGDGIPNENEAFDFEIGTDDLLQVINLPINRIFKSTDETIMLKLDIKALLDGIDLQTQSSTQTTDNLPLARQIADNMAGAFSY